MHHYICIHGHFYQPPRENPWLEELELQDSATPYHDWNKRITAECYAPNSRARTKDHEQKIIGISNNYEKISFNFGPTLLAWLEKNEPSLYQSIIEADKKSQLRFSGHGSAIALAYNHIIMPLANRQDKITQIRWGLADFEFRFGRKSEGMWLAETAVDLETLEIMAEAGLKFTILSPNQAKETRQPGQEQRQDTSQTGINTRIPYLCPLPSGKNIAIFFYDAGIAQDIAFGSLLQKGEDLAKRLSGSFLDENSPQLAHIATDGETYGHHHPFGDMALAYCLFSIEKQQLGTLTNYGEFLDTFPPTAEVRIHENSSWSCVHGVERWRANCGCTSGMHSNWEQSWRGPLRGAMDWLRDNISPIFEKEILKYVADPWAARNGYIAVILQRNPDIINQYIAKHATRDLNGEEKVNLFKLLEMQRHALLMYTSCGWFFDEISAIESVQILRYAARVMQLAQEISGIDFESAFLKILERAPSNIEDYRSGAGVFEKLVKPAALNLLRVGVHYAVSSLFKEYQQEGHLYSYVYSQIDYDRVESGHLKLAIGRISLQSTITYEIATVSFAVLHLGDHNVICGARSFAGKDAYSEMKQQIKETFLKSQIPELIYLIDQHFQTHSFSLWNLFLDEQRSIIKTILSSVQHEAHNSYRRFYRQHLPIMQFIRGLNIPLPAYFSPIAEFVLNEDFREVLLAEKVDFERLHKIILEIKQLSLNLHLDTLAFLGKEKIKSVFLQWQERPDDQNTLNECYQLVKILTELLGNLNLWREQNFVFSLAQTHLPDKRESLNLRDDSAQQWVDSFLKLADLLKVRV
jgi:alpha-amylase/alpha-mannosidase (GH57 family)